MTNQCLILIVSGVVSGDPQKLLNYISTGRPNARYAFVSID